MNTAKKIEFAPLPQGFSPRTLPEIMKLAKKITDDRALVYENGNRPFFMETERLIIRRFTSEDGRAVQELAIDRSTSSMKDFDEQWPTDLESCIGVANYFAGEDIYFAACLKPSMQLIGFIAYNTVDDDGILDLGHVWHTAYQDDVLDTEALSLMTQYAFEKLGVSGVCARNALDCKEQIAPLLSLGMEITETGIGSFVNDENGNPIEFTGCETLIMRDRWESMNPKGYSPKTKPDIISMIEKARENGIQYPQQYSIAPKGKTAKYSGAGWPHSNAFPAMFAAIALFYGKENRLNEKGEQINDDIQYRVQGTLSTEAYGASYSELFEGDNLKNCLGLYGIKTHVIDASDMARDEVRDILCTAVSSDITVILEPKEYKYMHFVFGYAEEGKVIYGCPFLDGDDGKNSSYSFKKYAKHRNRTHDIRRIILLSDDGEKLEAADVYKASLEYGRKMMLSEQKPPSSKMDFMQLRGGGVSLYDEWISLLEKDNEINSDKFYMEFPVFPHFIILYENRIHFCEFLRECVKVYGEQPCLMRLIEKCDFIRDAAVEGAQIGFENEYSDPAHLAMTNNERRNLLIDILEKCRSAETEVIALLKEASEVL